MSYKRTLNGHVSYRETVSLSYPASENGGTTSRTVSGTIPVNITVYVDTDSFDSSINRCNGQIRGLKGSVIAMNSAQCKAIEEAGQRISSHITRGFFSMIKSEISQNMSALLSKINSGIGLILEKVKLISHQRNIMESDYSRTKARYIKVFNELDEECRRRITEIDKKAFELSSGIQKERLYDMQSSAAVFSLLGINDTNILNTQLSAAALRNRTAALMNSLSADINNRLTYSKKLESVLHNTPSSTSVENCLPVLFAETCDIQNENEKNSYCFVNAEIGINASDKIINTVSNYFSANPNVWKQGGCEENVHVKTHFNMLAEQMLLESTDENTEKAQRIYGMIMHLRNNNTALTNSPIR